MDIEFILFWAFIVIIILSPDPVKTVVLSSVAFSFISSSVRN